MAASDNDKNCAGQLEQQLTTAVLRHDIGSGFLAELKAIEQRRASSANLALRFYSRVWRFGRTLNIRYHMLPSDTRHRLVSIL
ncbi:uncharacterized protein ARMOST_18978 [Armillaria ostoyae]|uniref:Uncharacterized protein n=1 Tax=Armillaria ostoyae TaxID=47428 RepID=A0A284S383_ARMOS|nr:uncharacterized protein ARMOST_18978 [Armillaria ostoyae]